VTVDLPWLDGKLLANLGCCCGWKAQCWFRNV